ncbi:hypothetical protein BDW62DRAFT_200076 [Aspergillus aurantiobrunneus]
MYLLTNTWPSDDPCTNRIIMEGCCGIKWHFIPGIALNLDRIQAAIIHHGNTFSLPGISIHVTVLIAEHNLGKWFEAARPAFERLIAEPECTFFEIYQSQDNPGELSWVCIVGMAYGGIAWILVQLKKDYYEPYLRITEPMFLKSRQVKVKNRLGGAFVIVKKENGGFQV